MPGIVQCIIQDWAKYWEEESVQLHQVYRQSFCYLSAASADLNDDGLFYHGRDLALRHPNFAYPRHQDQPLYSLSWVFQERLLSTRSISLTKNLGFFERARGLTCDTRDLARAILSDWLAPDETQRLRSVMSFFTGNQISLTNAGGVEVRITTTVPHGRDALGRVRAGGSSLRLLCAVALLTLEAPGWPAVEEALASLCRFRERWMHFCSGFDRNEDEPGDTLVRCYSVAPLFYAREEPPPDEEHIWDSHFIPLNALEPCKLAWGVYRRVGIVHVRIPYEPPDRGLEYEPPALPEDDEELPAVCRQSQACRLRPELCRFLGYVLKAAREAGIPFCGIEPDGRRITTII